MKYLLFFPVAMLFLISCESSPTQQESTSQETETETETEKTEIPKPPFEDIDVDQFKKMMSQPDVVLLDVRTPEETADGKIEGAIEINIKDADFKEKVLQLDKSKTYLVYCAAGARSATSCETMASMGFDKLYNLKDGYGAWSEAQ